MANRYQREIEEILHQDNMEAVPSKHGFFDRIFDWANASNTSRKPQGLNGSQFFLGSISLLLVALLLNALGLGFALGLAWVGLILFVISFFMFFTQSSGPIEKRWRGQLIDDSARPESFLRRSMRRFGRE